MYSFRHPSRRAGISTLVASVAAFGLLAASVASTQPPPEPQLFNFDGILGDKFQAHLLAATPSGLGPADLASA